MASFLTISCSDGTETNVWLLKLLLEKWSSALYSLLRQDSQMSVPWQYIYSFLMLLPNRPHSYVKFISNVHKHINTIKKRNYFHWILLIKDISLQVTISQYFNFFQGFIINVFCKYFLANFIMLKLTMLNKNLR